MGMGWSLLKKVPLEMAAELVAVGAEGAVCRDGVTDIDIGD